MYRMDHCVLSTIFDLPQKLIRILNPFKVLCAMYDIKTGVYKYYSFNAFF